MVHVSSIIYADVAELVDAQDLKSCEVHPSCRFDSGHLHQKEEFYKNSFFVYNKHLRGMLSPYSCNCYVNMIYWRYWIFLSCFHHR